MSTGDSANQPPAALPSDLLSWSWEEDKMFEEALLEFPEDTPNRWETIAARLPGRSAAEVLQHFEVLEKDLEDIEAGRIPLPGYTDDFCPGWGGEPDPKKADPWPKKVDPRSKKGVPWSEEEHRKFLIGLDRYGKGDWISISMNAVVTRTPIQVASHAQKYFLLQHLGSPNDRKRLSILGPNHDVTNPPHPPSQPYIRSMAAAPPPVEVTAHHAHEEPNHSPPL